MKFGLLLVLILYLFGCSFEYELGDPLQHDPDDVFFAGRGRRAFLESRERDPTYGSQSDDTREESRLRLWPRQFENLPAFSPPPRYQTKNKLPKSSANTLSIPGLNEPSVFYLWYNNIRKKQETKAKQADDSAFVAMRG